MRSVLAYTSARILLLVATMGLLYLLGARGFLLLALALVLSGLVSLVLLSGQRDKVSSALVSGVESGRRRLEQARSAEDPEPAEPVAASQPARSEPSPSAAPSPGPSLSKPAVDDKPRDDKPGDDKPGDDMAAARADDAPTG